MLWAAVVAFLLVRAFAAGVLGWRSTAAVPGAVAVTIDLNQSPVGELAALPGIGPVRATAIVLHRVRHGPFPTVAALARVDGIGPDTVERVRPHARVAGPVTAR